MKVVHQRMLKFIICDTQSRTHVREQTRPNARKQACMHISWYFYGKKLRWGVRSRIGAQLQRKLASPG